MAIISLIEAVSVGKVLLLVVLCAMLYLVRLIVFPPSNYPKNIPTIPFYVSFLGTYTSMDQKDIFEKYIRAKAEKYGAVKIIFGSRWNILVTRPEYLAQVLKDENTFAKSGNHKKIPYAVLSDYTGDNVISAHGAIWRKYRAVITHSVQFPEKDCVLTNTEKFINLIKQDMEESQSKNLPVGDYLQRLTLANICNSMLGTDFNTLEKDKPSKLHQRLKFVKSQIFKPLYMNFPMLDTLPIPERVKTREEVRKFREYLSSEIKARQVDPTNTNKSAAFELYHALQRGEITEKQFTDNIVIILVAGHENPQLFFTSLLYVMAKYPEIQSKLRYETNGKSDKQLEENGYMNSILFETLRLFPPLGQIINRETSKTVALGSDIVIPKGVYVGYNNFATGRDTQYWGPTTDDFIPERWGYTQEDVFKNYKLAKASARLSAFHGGRRACLGERFALYESRVFLKAVLDNFEVCLDESWSDRLTPAGPICPFMLRINFKCLSLDHQISNI
ncbi:hypothetical protein WICPIJ_002311 [Wickerhamomyces pijperi]|uniref:Uncharacterized protein n=1 Tax=Wickerhamomyces pijperi TaxID=599730 RepID=A0A9P8QC04_WICPI|nr:hypothetical protein WICPIJ_002311 [Wickerhamomyces pijperi]